MVLTLNKAAQTCGHAKSTLLDAIRSGRMSAPKDEQGRYAIDPAELHRAFPFQAPDRFSDQSGELQPTTSPTTSENHPTTMALEREVQLLREMLTKAETNAEHWRGMAERQQALLEDKRPRSFLQRLLGR